MGLWRRRGGNQEESVRFSHKVLAMVSGMCKITSMPKKKSDRAFVQVPLTPRHHAALSSIAKRGKRSKARQAAIIMEPTLEKEAKKS